MKKIIKQYNENEVSEVVLRIHEVEEDSDLSERLEEYKYYNHIIEFDLSFLDNEEWDVCDYIVDEYVEKIKENGVNSIPKIVISNNFSIIDGIHRLNAFLKLGIKEMDVLMGTNKKLELIKEEIVDEELQIKKYYNEFGHISVMENARYSPVQNSVSEFIVKDEYRNLGVGKHLVSHIKEKYGEIGAQISSKASLKVFAENGFDLLNEEEKIENINRLIFNTFNKDSSLKRDVYVDFVLKKWEQKYNIIKDKFIENGGSLFLTPSKTNKLKLDKKNDNVSKLKLRK